MFAAILALGLFASPPPAPCPAMQWVQCADTRALAANPGFREALQAFLGEAHARYLHGDRPLYGQVLELIARPETPARIVDADLRLFAGCRRFSCPEKAALVASSSGIVAIGIVDYSHGDPALEVIVRREDAGARESEAALRQWAASAVLEESKVEHADMSLHQVRVRTLDAEADSPAPAPRRRLFSFPRL